MQMLQLHANVFGQQIGYGGTPIQNDLKELWSLFDLFSQEDLGF